MTHSDRKRVPSIILDTDMGPDCDDAAALALLHALADRGEARIAGVVHCTSSPWGAGCIDAINRYCGRPDIPVGRLGLAGFLDEDQYRSYDRHVAERFPNRFRGGAEAPAEATALYRQLLSEAEPDGVTIAAIGPLINLARLMDSRADRHSPLDGEALVAAKVSRLVVMGGAFPSGSEWNFRMDPTSARAVVDRWPSPIWFSGYEVGEPIRTGDSLFEDGADPVHPARIAYERFLPAGTTTRSSWDLTAVHAAVRGAGDVWALVEGGVVRVDERGGNTWSPRRGASAEGPARAYLKPRRSPAEIERLLEALLAESDGRRRRAKT